MKTAMVVAVVLAAGVAHADRGDVDLLSDAAAHSYAGRHVEAIALYEQAFAQSGDHELLPILGVEYRKAGAQREAVQHFCTYLSFAPRGQRASFATTSVIALRRELGETVDARNVCAPTRVDFAPRPPRKRMSVQQRAALAGAAIGAASLGIGLYYENEARSVSNEIASHPANQPWPANINELEEQGQRAERRGMIFGAVGVTALVAAGVLWWTGRESETVIAPTVSASGAGVTLSRGF
jgi:hypothetical protein